MKDGPILDAVLANLPSSEGYPCFIRLLISTSLKADIDVQKLGNQDLLCVHSSRKVSCREKAR